MLMTVRVEARIVFRLGVETQYEPYSGVSVFTRLGLPRKCPVFLYIIANFISRDICVDGRVSVF